MNTTEINGKEYTLTEGEGGKLTLTPLIKQPRTPEAGDVYGTSSCNYLLFEDGYLPLNGRSDRISMGNCLSHSPWNSGNYTYLGKFSEVYVKIADVRDALSIEDEEGDSFLNRDLDEYCSSFRQHREALAKLGIK